MKATSSEQSDICSDTEIFRYLDTDPELLARIDMYIDGTMLVRISRYLDRCSHNSACHQPTHAELQLPAGAR